MVSSIWLGTQGIFRGNKPKQVKGKLTWRREFFTHLAHFLYFTMLVQCWKRWHSAANGKRKFERLITEKPRHPSQPRVLQVLSDSQLLGSLKNLCHITVTRVFLNTIKKSLMIWVRERTIRPNDRSLSAKWLPTVADRGCHVVSVTDPYGRILGFLDRNCYFSIK
jgi:hypothetical protein